MIEVSEGFDNVNRPAHYASGKYECIEVMLEELGRKVVMDFCLGNAFKYLWRHQKKNGIEDLRKCKWYLDKFLELHDSDITQISNNSDIAQSIDNELNRKGITICEM